MPTRLGTEGKEKQWGVWLRAVTTRHNIGLNQWRGGGGGYSTYNGEAAEDISQPDFQSKFRCSENNGKTKQHNPSNVECGSADSVSYLRGDDTMGSNYVAHPLGHVERNLAVQGKDKRSEDVPRLERLQLCDEVEDQETMVPRGGSCGGKTAGSTKINVEQHHVEVQPVCGQHATCGATVVNGCSKGCNWATNCKIERGR
jgi:hypothetical protein